MSKAEFNCAALFSSVATLMAAPALAQSSALPTTTESAAAPEDEVVVTGIRASTERAIQIKERSDQVIDTVSATEIGELPDFNAGDALKHRDGAGVAVPHFNWVSADETMAAEGLHALIGDAHDLFGGIGVGQLR